MNQKLVSAAWVALGVIVAVPATGWFLSSGARQARQLTFRPDGTDLKATDVDEALRELSQKVKVVEAGQVATMAASASAQTAAEEAKAKVTASDEALQVRLKDLEERIGDSALPRHRIEYSDSGDTSSVTANYKQLRTLGGFGKRSARSTVMLTWNTHVDAVGEPGTFCDFQIRVDGKPDAERDGGGGRAVVYVPQGATSGSSPVAVAALFTRPGAGAHTASVWVRGTASECLENYGNFPRTVIVEEGPQSE